MKKIFSLILLFVLVACGSSDGDNITNDVTTTTTTQTAPPTNQRHSHPRQVSEVDLAHSGDSRPPPLPVLFHTTTA